MKRGAVHMDTSVDLKKRRSGCGEYVIPPVGWSEDVERGVRFEHIDQEEGEFLYEVGLVQF